MTSPVGLPGEQESKWMLKAAISCDPRSLTKNLATFTAVAFSATVLYVMLSKLKRPQYHHIDNQVTFSDDENKTVEDRTSKCEVLCPTSTVGCGNESLESAMLMGSGLLIKDIEPTRRPDAFVGVNNVTEGLGSDDLTASRSLNLEVQSSMATRPSGFDAAEVDKSAGRLYSNTTKTKKLTSSMKFVQNSPFDVNMVSEAAVGGNLMRSGVRHSQIQPSYSAGSGPSASEDADETAAKLAEFSVSEIPLIQFLNRASGVPVRISGPNDVFTGLSTSDQLFCLCEKCCEAHKEPSFTIEDAHYRNEIISRRTPVDHRRRPEGKSSVRSWKELDGCDKNGAEDLCSFEKGDDDERRCEGYTYGIIRGKVCKSCKRYLRGEISIAKEIIELEKGVYSQKKLSFGGPGRSNRDSESCIQTREDEDCGSSSDNRKPQSTVRERSINILSTMLADNVIPRQSDCQTQTASTEGLGCRDIGTSTSVSNACMRRGVRTRRSLTHPHSMTIEETKEECTSCGHSQLRNPLQQAQSPLKALTETQHWLNMSLLEQYEYLELLGNILEAAAGE